MSDDIEQTKDEKQREAEAVQLATTILAMLDGHPFSRVYYALYLLMEAALETEQLNLAQLVWCHEYIIHLHDRVHERCDEVAAQEQQAPPPAHSLH